MRLVATVFFYPPRNGYTLPVRSECMLRLAATAVPLPIATLLLNLVRGLARSECKIQKQTTHTNGAIPRSTCNV